MGSFIKSKILSTYKELRTDEELLRLLFYPPKNVLENTLDPLDVNLPDIFDDSSEKYWKIVDGHLLRTSKADDLEEIAICRIYVYAGKIRPTLRNERTTKQEIVIDVFCHHMYEKDMRLEMIADRLSKIMFLNRVEGGLGRVDYRNGYDFTAPKGYQAYRHIYEVGGTK